MTPHKQATARIAPPAIGLGLLFLGLVGCNSDGISPPPSTTPTPTPTPAPTVTLSASPTSVNAGGASTLTWSSTNATSCTASGAWSGNKTTSGTQNTGALSATSTFTLTCTGAGSSGTQSTTVTVSATPPPTDTTPPAISNISVSNITTTSATVTWTTNENSSTQVQYGTTSAYGSIVNGANNTTSHSVNITGLTAGTTYHYRVVSTDAANNTAQSANATFTTTASGIQRAFCETQSVIYCNGLENANPPGADTTFFLMDPYSGGRQTTTYLAEGYSNSQILGTGALRFNMHDGGEDDTGISYPNGAPVNLPTQLNVGFVFRLGPNYLAPHLEGAKFIMAYATNSVRGWRPTVFLQFVTDTQGRVGPAGSRYAVLTAADDGAGYVSDEFGQAFPQDAYASGLTHTFRLNNYVGQWIYVEWEVRAQGTHRLYVATRDGAFRGREGEPLAEIASAIVPESLPWTVGRSNAYTEAMSNTTADTYVDVDLLRLNNSYMGPPPGFFD